MDYIARWLVLFGAASMGLLALVACGTEEPTPTTAPVTQPTPTPVVTEGGEAPIVSVSGDDYSFDAPDTIAAGQTTLRFANEGQEAHELQLMRFNEGVLIHQFMQTLHQGGGLEAALQMASGKGGVATIVPGQTAEATVDLPEGEYVLICRVPSPGDSVAHALKGMVKPLTVTAAP